MESLIEDLREKELLLVLDNLEQLVGVAPLLARLLGGAPGLKVLTTSRERLGVRGELLVPVEPLGVPPQEVIPRLDAHQAVQYAAVQLFGQRAEAVKPGFIVTDETARPVAEICHRLDGLPLAIELAAARIRLFPPSALLKRLETRLPVLTGERGICPSGSRRCATPSPGAMTCSTTKSRRSSGVSPSLRAGRASKRSRRWRTRVGAGCLTHLASLVDKSLVRQREEGEEPRFTMLETIREFGLEQLAASGEEAEETPAARYLLSHAGGSGRACCHRTRATVMVTPVGRRSTITAGGTQVDIYERPRSGATSWLGVALVPCVPGSLRRGRGLVEQARPLGANRRRPVSRC